MFDLETGVLNRLREALEQNRAIEGLLFHGTGEPIDGNLKPGPDGLLWATDDPLMAQQYIPDSGMKAACHYPLSYEWGHRVLPNKNSILYKIAVMMTGIEPDDVQRDSMGRVTSWVIPEGWPTNAQVIDYLEEELGYQREDFGGVWVKTTFLEGQEVIKPNEWRLSGKLFIALSDGLILKDLRRSEEGDLSDPDHIRYEEFAEAEAEGYDGVIINDFAQAEGYGNVGHVAYGINANGLEKLTWIQLPAVNYDLANKGFQTLTPELEAWMEEVASMEIVVCP